MAHHIPKITYGLIPTSIVFDYPPKEDDGEQLEAIEKVSTSNSGLRQVQVQYTEGTRKLKFQAVSETIRTQLETFFKNHAQYGKPFRYYDDQNSIDYVEFELKSLALPKKRTGIAGDNLYTYQIPLTLRRVVGVTAEEAMSQEIINNQAVPLEIDGLILDSSSYKSAKIFFEIFRKTDSSEIVANGYLTATYKESLLDWEITAEGTFDGDAHGLTFTVDDDGQVYYVSDNMAGSNYEGQMVIREFLLNGS